MSEPTTEYRLVLEDGSMFGTVTTDLAQVERLQRIATRRLTPRYRVKLRIEQRTFTPWTEKTP